MRRAAAARILSRARWTLAALGVGVSLLLAAPAWPVSVQENLWVTNGTVDAIEVAGNTVYLGGSFTRVGPAVGACATIDAGTAQVQQPYTGIAGYVRAVTPDGNGGLYIGGYFTSVQQQPRSNLAHLDANGVVTSWNPQVAGEIREMSLSAGKLYIAGYFSSVDGLPRGRLAAFDEATGVLTTWNPNANAAVAAMIVYGDVVFAGGAFTQLGGAARSYIGAVSTATGLATSWAPQANDYVLALALAALPVFPNPLVAIFAGGTFSAIGGQPRSRLAVIEATTGSAQYGQAAPWNPGADATVYALAVTGYLNTTLYAGGYFANIGGQPRNAIAAIDNMGAATGWNPNPTGDGFQKVEALLLRGNTIYVGGLFRNIGGAPRSNLAQIDRTTGAATSWDPFANYPVEALAEAGGKVFAGGVFTSIGGVPRSNLAALDATTGAATAWNPGPNNAVHALKSGGGKLYVGGEFSVIGGSARSRLAEIDGSGAVTAWNPNPNNTVLALEYRSASPGNLIYLGGDFGNVGGMLRNRLAAVTDDTNALITSWNPNADFTVSALRLSGGTIYAGGRFNTVAGQPHRGLAKIDLAGAVLSFPEASGRVNALVSGGGRLYIGGEFGAVGGQPHYCAAAIDEGTGTVTSWDPILDGTEFIWHNQVQALAVSGTTVLVGGAFDTMGGLPRDAFGAADAGTGAVASWVPKVFHYGDQPIVSCATLSGGKLYIGGYFTAAADHPQSGIAALYLSGLVAVDEPGAGSPAAALRAGPNPFRTGVTLRLALSGADAVDIDVFDLEGRRVRRLHPSSITPGEHLVTWDGRDEAGREVAAGVYVARAEAGGRRATAKILKLGDAVGP